MKLRTHVGILGVATVFFALSFTDVPKWVAVLFVGASVWMLGLFGFIYLLTTRSVPHRDTDTPTSPLTPEERRTAHALLSQLDKDGTDT